MRWMRWRAIPATPYLLAGAALDEQRLEAHVAQPLAQLVAPVAHQAAGSSMTSTQTDIGVARMAYLQGE